MAGSASLLICMFLGPRFIDYLRLKEFGQHIREDGPAGHQIKQGTPTMGGVLFVLSAAIPFLILSQYTAEGLTVFFITLACGAIGFIDDYIKVTHRRSLGLSGRWKLILLAAITVGVGWVVQEERIDKSVYVPVLDWKIGLSVGFFVLAWGAANATPENPVSPSWLVVTYFLHTCGELALSPVGLSSMTKLAPRGRVGQMMGVWFIASALGNLMAGLVAGSLATLAPASLFSYVAMIVGGAGLVAVVASPFVKRLTGGVQ